MNQHKFGDEMRR